MATVWLLEIFWTSLEIKISTIWEEQNKTQLLLTLPFLGAFRSVASPLHLNFRLCGNSEGCFGPQQSFAFDVMMHHKASVTSTQLGLQSPAALCLPLKQRRTQAGCVCHLQLTAKRTLQPVHRIHLLTAQSRCQFSVLKIYCKHFILCCSYLFLVFLGGGLAL